MPDQVPLTFIGGPPMRRREYVGGEAFALQANVRHGRRLPEDTFGDGSDGE